MILNNKFLQYFCIILLIYSLIGGLFVPLSPAIEEVSYRQTDSFLNFELSVPKLKEKYQAIRLVKSYSKDTSTEAIESLESCVGKDSIHVSFPHPKFYSNFKKGDALDLIIYTEKWGQMRYFSAFYIDSSIGNLALNTKKIELKEKPFHLSFPNRTILKESIRNLFFHVPMWFTMIGLLIYSLIQSILFLSNGKSIHDDKASQSALVAMIFGTLGILTGMIWAKFTWGAFWTNDPKLNGAAIGMLAYLAYFVLRGSVEDEIKRAKLSAVYNIFSFTIYMVFIMVLPRINQSLHPGNGGNPGFNIYEQDNVMRLFFYPAVIGWGLLGFWLTELYLKIKLKNQ
jgi:heme exporter protein C